MTGKANRPAIAIMKKCTYCGKEYPDEASICTIDQQPLRDLRPPPLNQAASWPSPPFSAPAADAQQIIDDEHLKMLSIFHYVIAGLALVGLLFLCLHFAIMTAVFSTPQIWKSQNNQSGPPVQFLIPFFMFFYLFLGGVIAVAGVLNFLSARFLRQRKHRTFSLVTAALNCLHIPFGTVLGVFTFIVLSRPSVRGKYTD